MIENFINQISILKNIDLKRIYKSFGTYPRQSLSNIHIYHNGYRLYDKQNTVDIYFDDTIRSIKFYFFCDKNITHKFKINYEDVVVQDITEFILVNGRPNFPEKFYVMMNDVISQLIELSKEIE